MIKIPLHEGYLAARNGKQLEDNPYDMEKHIDAYCDWTEGFCDGLRDNICELERPWYYIKPLTFYLFLLVATTIFTLWCIFL